ncbi:MAG: ACT domain-containing protein [Ruthenibacterium lactatiformans]
MICQSAPRAATIDFSFTMPGLILNPPCRPSRSRTGAGSAPLISSGYSKINLFGEEMVTSCGVAALALRTLRDAGIEVVLITTSDLDISLLVRGENEDSALNVLRQAFAA